ncbi:hypothetical protein ZTR_09863 [Talaromyces verruculosus]|nr:hypothetical protein ZTR_09863 [Talaromyces verruculosus]
MGDDDTSTLYAVELRGIGVALNSIMDNTEQCAAGTENDPTSFVDSQAALKVLRQPRMPSRQIYLEGCLNLIRRHEANGKRTELRWIPAHQGEAGNELADQRAKEAAQEPQGLQNTNNRCIRLAAAAKRRIRREAKAECEKSWFTEKTSGPTKRLIDLPTKKTLEYCFAAYLRRINRRESARCDCDPGNQTINHILAECPPLQIERNRMRNAPSDSGVTLRPDELLTRPEARAIVAEFMIRTISWNSSEQSTQPLSGWKKATKKE